MEWPPQATSLKAVLSTQEHALLEYKRQWYDLSTKRGKAEFVKDVLAMANATEPATPGYILVGVEDVKLGSGIIGVTDPPSNEQLQQVLASYTTPAPELDCVHVPLDGKIVSAMRITWTPSLPYHAIRDHEGVLDDRLVYTRRGATIGVLRGPEIEALIRHKQNPLQFPPGEGLVAVGFVENGSARSNASVLARIVNLTETEITGLSVLWDVQLPAWPEIFSRTQTFFNGSLAPGETKEEEFAPSDQYYVGANDKVNVRSGSYEGTRWFDITLRVQFRDRNGFFQQVERRISTGR
jgi:Putative DNA-binding domain